MVLGGPHVTLIPEDAQPHADAIVVGYAEETWPQLLRDFAAGRHAAALRSGARGCRSAGRPFPRRDLLPRGRYLTDNVFEATRGCVHKLRLLRRARRPGDGSRSRSRSRTWSRTSASTARAS